MASEAGVVDIAPQRIRQLGRLQPGRMLLVDTVKGELVDDMLLKTTLARKHPYRDWVHESLVRVDRLPVATQQTIAPLEGADLLQAQQVHGYTREDLRLVLTPMAETGTEALGAMGDDGALAVLSEQPQPLFNYFKQLFAQVTNPPIDAIREASVMSLRMVLGATGNLCTQSSLHCRQLELGNPVLTNLQLAQILELDRPGLMSKTLPTLFENRTGGLEDALVKLCESSVQAIKAGATILVLSDRGHDVRWAPIPSLLAVSAVHSHLCRIGMRYAASLVAAAGDVREVMHFCTLLGYGASAVNPYLAFDSLLQLKLDGLIHCDNAEATNHYVQAVNKGVLKVLSKMGISTLSGYHGAQIFEALGLGDQLIEQYFPNTPSRLGGIQLETLETECLMRHEAAFIRESPTEQGLAWGSRYKWRRDGERHQLTPNVIGLLQHGVRSADYSVFKKYTRLVDRHTTRACELRGLLDFVVRTPVNIDEVEPAADIVTRFRTGAMSFGSLSKEAHETLAIAMNELGGRSNSGEGGEDPERHLPDSSSRWRNSAIKQIASGRFGVTPSYLLSATELQIKMAQGAKPGEGGHLPGYKVNEPIAAVRHCVPGTDLISPPPHHDIYSIEDLAQLIHDLQHANQMAEVSVKLVSEIGVGTIAAGVAKAKADRIVISGHSGGTGAATLGSIKHAGLPWELGLAETQQVLVANNLRGRVALETDGQLKTGRDVVMAALLGAESYSFGTAALIASGCILTRVCHLNTCPVGVATQDPELRKRFTGIPDHVMNFMLFVAEEVREILASLGVRKMDDLVGQSQLLRARSDLKDHWKAKYLDLDRLLYCATLPSTSPRRRQEFTGSHAPDHFANSLLERAAPALTRQRQVTIKASVRNHDRSIGTLLSSAIVREHGAEGLPPRTVRLDLTGAAGQSLGAFLAPGVDIVLRGVANDAVGKGMAGGRITIRERDASVRGNTDVRIGNAALYGATGGSLFLQGTAGERFAVRNSGASAVAEGIGDHGCEYMTAGTIVILGPAGRNFAAGMSGGVAYVLDVDGRFQQSCNLNMVDIRPLSSGDESTVRDLIREHYRLTESRQSWEISTHWPSYQHRILKVLPNAPRLRAEQSASATSRVQTRVAG